MRYEWRTYTGENCMAIARSLVVAGWSVALLGNARDGIRTVNACRPVGTRLPWERVGQ